jgi:hypothetical protein
MPNRPLSLETGVNFLTRVQLQTRRDCLDGQFSPEASSREKERKRDPNDDSRTEDS